MTKKVFNLNNTIPHSVRLVNPMRDSATKLAVKVCNNGQWWQDINAMEDNDGGKCNPTYIDQRTHGRGVVAECYPTYIDQRTKGRGVLALFSGFENDA
jgi:hypothetical protein